MRKLLLILLGVCVFVSDGIKNIAHMLYSKISPTSVVYAQGTWTALKADSPELKTFANLITASDTIYSKHSLKYLQRKITRNNMKSFIYDDGNFKILLSFVRYPDKTWRIFHAVPVGTFDKQEAFKIGWTKIREFSRVNGITAFWSKEPLAYTNSDIQDALDKSIKSYEHYETEIYSDHIIKKFNMVTVGDDNDWSDKPVRTVRRT